MTTLKPDSDHQAIGPMAADRLGEAPALVPEAEPAQAATDGVPPTAGTPRAQASGRQTWATWLVPLGLAVLAGFGLMSSPGLRHGQAATAVAACQSADWQTTVAVDGSRPEKAMTTLRSRNAVGPAGAGSCVEVRLACLPEGPYFEVRLASPAPAIREVGPLQIRNLNDELSAQVFQPPGSSDSAVRIADKPAVELIAFALANSMAFRVPITLSTGDFGIADFKSYHFSSAVRPVLFACSMRALQNEDAEDEDSE